MNLTEQYKQRLSIAESVYSRAHEGAKMDSNRKLMVATCLNNVNKFLTEAFTSADATQRSAMADYKKFCINLVNVALPNLIAPELVLTHPMTSLTGYVAYVQYTTGKAKGETAADTILNNPFRLGDAQTDYTSLAVTESVTAGTGAQALAWLQNDDVVHEAFPVTSGGVTTYYDIKLVKSGAADIYGFYNKADKKFYSTYSGGSYTSQITVAADTKVAYKYDNVVIPQDNLPTIKAEMKSIPLLAKARRIAVYFSQMAAFQAKTDYGFDLGDQLAEKAVGELNYEIDTEIVKLLEDTAKAQSTYIPAWSKTLPVGVKLKLFAL